MNAMELTLLLLIFVALLPVRASAEEMTETMVASPLSRCERVWHSEKVDSGSVHALGNGGMLVFSQGPNIIQLFGPPYSSGVCGHMTYVVDSPTEVRSTRERGAAIWTHQLEVKGLGTATMCEFVDADSPCYVRTVETTTPLTFDYAVPEAATVVSHGDAANAGFLIREAPGTPIYGPYPNPVAKFYKVIVTGDAQWSLSEDGNVARLTFMPGKSTLIVAGGTDLPSTIENAETAIKTSPETMLNRTQASWHTFTDSRKNWAMLLPQDTPHRDVLLEAIDDVAVVIKVHQGVEGSVLAGYPYHLGYVRDQFGVARALLALGHIDDAKQILEFYWNVFEKHDRIQNAQGIGVDNVFHVHENDEVELTGYLICQAFDYLTVSGDDAYIERILPMLVWAHEVQKKHLYKDMLPFNGDETYVACGVLPRSTLNDGSSESTLLFHLGGCQLMDWIAERNLWTSERLEENRTILASVASSFRRNFLPDGRYITNNPDRAEMAPRFRHGVCMGCGPVVWTERNNGNLYLCPTCLAKNPDGSTPPKTYELLSAGLIPYYLGFGPMQESDFESSLEALAVQFERTGIVTARPDTDIAMGYDCGLLLNALAKANHPKARDAYDHVLSLRTQTGVWTEYYRTSRPSGTRYRPWESAINIEALLVYAMAQGTQNN